MKNEVRVLVIQNIQEGEPMSIHNMKLLVRGSTWYLVLVQRTTGSEQV